MTHMTSGTVLIWISQWEYQCCGAPVTVGDVVNLTVHPAEGVQAWEATMGGAIALAAAHHVSPEDSYHLRVEVARVVEARGHLESDGDEGRDAAVGDN